MGSTKEFLDVALQSAPSLKYSFKVTGTEFPENPSVGDVVLRNGEIYVYLNEESGFERISATEDASTPRKEISRKFIRNLKCKYCGATLDINAGDRMDGFAICPYCESYVNIYDD